MACTDTYTDNRDSCAQVITSSCVPYVGYISSTIKDSLPCKPNINDVLKKLQELVDKNTAASVDNTTLDKKCFSFTPATVKQSELNQLFITEICTLKSTSGGSSSGPIDQSRIKYAVDLLCLEDPACTPKTEYTGEEIFDKLLGAYCDLLKRVLDIETLLNI
jgi:hypothetical protein